MLLGTLLRREGGLFGALKSAGKRILTGESLFMTLFTHQGSGKARIAFAAPYPGHILAIKLDSLGGTLERDEEKWEPVFRSSSRSR